MAPLLVVGGTVVVVVGGGIAAVPLPSQTASPPSADETAVRAVVSRYVDAREKRDSKLLEALCERVIIINHGEIVADDTLTGLTNRHRQSHGKEASLEEIFLSLTEV